MNNRLAIEPSQVRQMIHNMLKDGQFVLAQQLAQDMGISISRQMLKHVNLGPSRRSLIAEVRHLIRRELPHLISKEMLQRR